MKSLKEKIAEMKNRIKAKKEQIMKKMKGMTKEAASAGGVALGLAILAAAPIAGCAFERADPAARSNRAAYTVTSTVVNSTNVTNNVYVSDGLLATADGAGAITQPSTQTTTQNPELSGALDPITAGINAAGKVAVAGVNAYAAKGQGAKAECQGADCADGSCGLCEGGACDVPAE